MIFQSQSTDLKLMRNSSIEECNMFGLFKKDPVKNLQKNYEEKLSLAMEAQRSGDIRSFSELSDEADSILKQIEMLKQDAG